MGIKIRSKTLRSGNLVVYLDIIHKNKRQNKNISIIDRKAIAGKIRKNNRNKPEDEINEKIDKEVQKVLKEELRNAELIKAKLDIELFEEGLITYAEKGDISFYDYYKKIAERTSNETQKNYNSAIKHFKYFMGQKPITLKHINRDIIQGFKDYLEKLDLETPTKAGIFKKIKTTVRAAYIEELIPQNYAAKVPGFPVKGGKIDYLVFDEVQRLYQIEPKDEVLKIFLFGCFTGLRISDLMNLKYHDIRDGAIYITQKKTRETVFIPIHETAQTLINLNEKDKDKFVFNIRSITPKRRAKLRKHFKAAGIDKRAFFHLSRHTFATMSLSFGADLYTVSKLLGHTEISITQRYAKVIDENKKKAISLIPTINKPERQ